MKKRKCSNNNINLVYNKTIKTDTNEKLEIFIKKKIMKIF